MVKFIPVIQMAGMLVNNTMYHFNINVDYDYIIDFLFRNSFANTIVLYVISITFGFCKWHRVIILANFINIVIANVDRIYNIPISDIQLLCSYYIVAAIAIITITYYHVKDNKKHIKQNEFEDKDT